MIRRIILENFMAHPRTVIEPAEGLTVLTGPNNCGKSAIVTALQTVCGNERGGFMVRHGADECRVTIETDDGHVIQWERSKKGVRYVIDGRAIDRLRGGIPDDLHEHLRLPTVESADGSGEFDIHFGQQKRPIFLLDQNGRQAAAFFASSSDAALLVEMQTLHKKRVQERRQNHRTLTREVQRRDRMIESLSGIEQIVEEATALEARYEEIRQESIFIDRLSLVTQDLTLQSRRCDDLAGQHAVLSRLAEPPGRLPVEAAERTIDQLTGIERACRQAASEQTILQGLQDPPQLADFDPLKQVADNLTTLSGRVDRLSKTEHALADLPDLPELDDEAVLDSMMVQLKELMTIGARETVCHRILAELENPPELPSLVSLTNLIEELAAAESAGSQLHAELQRLEDERLEVIEALFAWADENPSCPVCGGAVSGEHLLEHQGADHNAVT